MNKTIVCTRTSIIREKAIQFLFYTSYSTNWSIGRQFDKYQDYVREVAKKGSFLNGSAIYPPPPPVKHLPLKGHSTGDFGYLFFSLNMLGQPRKYGCHQKKLPPIPLRGSYDALKSSRYCPVPRDTVQFLALLSSFLALLSSFLMLLSSFLELLSSFLELLSSSSRYCPVSLRYCPVSSHYCPVGAY